MKYVIVITGASSGFGALTARVVASSGRSARCAGCFIAANETRRTS
jgi:NADP-dependent 3-hydroxy acid dehydrogenase YdfG